MAGATHRNHRNHRVPRVPWARWRQEDILDLRFSDLGVRIDDTWLEACLEDLQHELHRRGLRFRPHVWLSSEFFSPDRVPGFAVPFYLAHPRLMRLERSMMLEVEGGTREECLQIFRHECGHALQHAYGLHRRGLWQRHFGSATQKYPEVYRPNPTSREFVQHLRLFYAQSHPVEDFAETFAVWLRKPESQWRKRYRGWPALRKLEYVDALMQEIADEPPVLRTRRQIEPLSELRGTLRQHYEAKREQYSIHYPDTYDGDLRRLFSDEYRHRHRELASSFLRRNRTEIRRLVSRWTGEYEFTLEQVLKDMIGRCRELRLRAIGPERRLRTEFAVLLTVKTMNFHYSRRNWVAL
jgi:putative zinc-binding metallo-peptidase